MLIFQEDASQIIGATGTTFIASAADMRELSYNHPCIYYSCLVKDGSNITCLIYMVNFYTMRATQEEKTWLTVDSMAGTVLRVDAESTRSDQLTYQWYKGRGGYTDGFVFNEYDDYVISQLPYQLGTTDYTTKALAGATSNTYKVLNNSEEWYRCVVDDGLTSKIFYFHLHKSDENTDRPVDPGIPGGTDKPGESEATEESVNPSVDTTLEKPAAPALTSSSTGVTVRWNKVEGATGYKLYRSTNGGGYKLVKTITKGTTLSYKDTGATTNGAKYRYKIKAVATVGDATYTSSYSGVATTYVLSKQSIKRLTSSTSRTLKVTLNARNSKATGYQISYSRSASFSSAKTKTITSYKTLTATIKQLTKGKKYYVRVRAYKRVDGKKYYSSWSAKKSLVVR